uniref:Peptidase S8/S53 domain-containing protein n=1 Tax=Panagrolaimus sp. ES5 TaxID=591445 RepID=A0AC34FPI7_9BILA
MAIIDGGIDVSLDGFNKTSKGLPKIIDCFDFTGAGNVDTSLIKIMDSENTLIGLSGRTVKIPSNWKNPSGKFHLGIKSLHKPELPDSTTKILEEIEKFPEIDCIVWFDGEKWVAACIDISFNENLENFKILQNYRNGHEYGTLFGNVTYCVTINNEGNSLEIFMSYSRHGSCVAQIAAAHFPDESKKDGLAPGAQIISMNVLHPMIRNRLDENAIKKAFKKSIEMRVDIINYSCAWPTQ